ncbi:MAG: cysteine--tRNA ligase [Flavobacteriales bacterium]|nr:cysteine--tRNA ligase [Flavobacteriales bacterium]
MKPEHKDLHVYNTLTAQKEPFSTIIPGYVGMYVCGPTVYSDVHLGNCRTFISFDVIYRYLKHLGYKVRYVRNITDVGHLEGDADIGAEDKISKKARLEKIEPMEVTQRYTLGFHDMMQIFNIAPPDIEPRATGHIIEQIDMVQKILDNGFAYVVNGSVYFDTQKFANESNIEGYNYGKLSGRILEDLFTETRDLKNQGEKRNASDFAIWIKAAPEHIMKWKSPWSIGFPGWHLECSAMSTKYLGETFDIHGGGGDLKFPHHENEIAQNAGSCGKQPAKYWLHGNMLLLNGKKMSKSDGNSITPQELFAGGSEHISKGYSPMMARFLMLLSHYTNPLDLTNKALSDAEKGYDKLTEMYNKLQELVPNNDAPEFDYAAFKKKFYSAMNDNFNSPLLISHLYGLSTEVNKRISGEGISAHDLEQVKSLVEEFMIDVLGLRLETQTTSNQGVENELMELILELRAQAKSNKDFGTADLIRNKLSDLNITLKDSREGTEWSYE